MSGYFVSINRSSFSQGSQETAHLYYYFTCIKLVSRNLHYIVYFYQGLNQSAKGRDRHILCKSTIISHKNDFLNFI